MKLDMNNLEQAEQLSEIQRIHQMEAEPPKMERTAETSVKSDLLKGEQPPKLDKDTNLGGSVMEMKLEMDKLKYEQLKEQLYGESDKLGETREEFNRRKAYERADNAIQRNNRMEELEKAREEAARKEEEYRKKLYG